MAEPKRLTSIEELNPQHIQVQKRLRPASASGVDAVKASVLELGIIKDAIHVRRKKDKSFVLIAGLHRLTAALELGWLLVPVVAWECTNDWARMMEIDDNVAGADLTPLDTAIFLAERKKIYEKLHPETKQGSAGAEARWNATDTMSVASFSEATAEKFGMSDRHVRRLIAVGGALDHDQIRWLREAKKPVTLKDLDVISKISEPGQRAKVCIALTNGDAKNAAAAVRDLKPRDVKQADKDPIETAFLDLKARWMRAPKVAQRRFAEAIQDELTAILSEGAE